MSTSSFELFAQNSKRKCEAEVRYHLAKVYTCLGSASAFAAIGSGLHMSGILQTGILSAIVWFGLVIALYANKDDGRNFYLRLGLLLAVGFCLGQAVGPLLEYFGYKNPVIIATALTGSIVVFFSLTLSALFAEHRKYLFLGGLLASILNTFAWIWLFSVFMKSYFLEQACLFVGLIGMAGYVLYDTQAIIEKRRMGNTDCIEHSLDLFIDVVDMFRFLLIILGNKPPSAADKGEEVETDNEDETD